MSGPVMTLPVQAAGLCVLVRLCDFLTKLGNFCSQLIFDKGHYSEGFKLRFVKPVAPFIYPPIFGPISSNDSPGFLLRRFSESEALEHPVRAEGIQGADGAWLRGYL
jgi:hypothetical protein